MPRGGKPVTTADLIADKCELEDRLERLKEKSARLRKETYEEIDRLNDARYMDVLEKIFIDGLDLNDAADVLGYGRRHVQRLYSEALKALTVDE